MKKLLILGAGTAGTMQEQYHAARGIPVAQLRRGDVVLAFGDLARLARRTAIAGKRRCQPGHGGQGSGEATAPDAGCSDGIDHGGSAIRAERGEAREPGDTSRDLAECSSGGAESRE